MLDKDKLLLIAYVNTKSCSRERGILKLNSIKKYLTETFDESVKIIVYPVLEDNLQKIEVYNSNNITDEIASNFNEIYENVLDNLCK